MQIVGVEITRFNNNEVSKSLTLFYEENNNSLTFVHPSLACIKTISGAFVPRAGTTYKNVTGSAIYDTASDGYGGYYYRPRRVEGVTTGTTKFTLQYSTGGGRLNTSLQSTHTGGIHEIFLEKSSPTPNQVYSTTLISSYYYNVTSGFVDPHHVLYFTVGTSYHLTWNLPPYTNY